MSSFTTLAPAGPERESRWRSLRFHPYFRVKDVVEWRFLEAARRRLPVSIVNPMMCLGPWDEKERRLCFVPLVLTGELTYAMRHVLNVVDVRDVARALVGAVENGVTGEPILVSGHNITMTMLYRWLFDTSGVYHQTFEVPAEVAVTMGFLLGDPPDGDESTHPHRLPEPVDSDPILGSRGLADATRAGRKPARPSPPLWQRRSPGIAGSGIARRLASRVVVPDDLVERRVPTDGVSGEPAGHDGRLDAALVEAAVGPVAGDRQVVVVQSSGEIR